jgi:hypothetical protein
MNEYVLLIENFLYNYNWDYDIFTYDEEKQRTKLKQVDTSVVAMIEGMCPIVERCKIHSKLKDDKVETYVLIKEFGSELPFTFFVTCIIDTIKKEKENSG